MRDDRFPRACMDFQPAQLPTSARERWRYAGRAPRASKPLFWQDRAGPVRVPSWRRVHPNCQ